MNKVVWQENNSLEKWTFKDVYTWWEWMNNRSNKFNVQTGKLIVGDFKAENNNRLTRQEAIDIYQNNYSCGLQLSKTAIDTYVALGMLKLKEEKKIEQPKDFIDGISAEDWDTIKSVETVIQYNEFVNSKIVRKLLNIINRRKP